MIEQFNEDKMIAEVMDATGLPEDVAREIVAIERGESPGDVIADGTDAAPFVSIASALT